MKKNQAIAVAVGVGLVAFFLYGNAFMNFFSGNNSNTTMQQTSGVVIEDLVQGSGAEAKPGDMITVHYVGTFMNGQVFDSSRDRNEPFQFTLGQGRVIRGWDEGLVGLKVGGKRRLTIYPDYGYGSQGAGPIPPNSTLIFEVELLGVSTTPAQ